MKWLSNSIQIVMELNVVESTKLATHDLSVLQQAVAPLDVLQQAVGTPNCVATGCRHP